MRDRTSEFQNRSNNGGPPIQSITDIELGSIADSQDEDQLQSVLNLVSQIQSSIRRFQADMPEVERLQGRLLLAVDASQEHAYRQQLERLNGQCEQLAYAIRAQIKELELHAERCEPSSTNARLRQTQKFGVVRKFRDALLEYHDLQLRYREKQKSRFQRQYRIVNPDASEEEVGRLLTADYTGPVFAQSVLRSTLADDARRILDDVEDRHVEIVNLSRSITQLQSLFDDLSTFVQAQDEMVNQVAFQVDNVQSYMVHANDQLGKAVKNAHTARRRKWCLAALCLVLLGVLVLVVMLVVVPRLKDLVSKN